MKLHWTVEKDQTVILRDHGWHPRAHVGHMIEGWVSIGWGWNALILEPGLPWAGPYKSMVTACRWVERVIILKCCPEATFSEIPKFRWRGSCVKPKDSQPDLLR